VRVVLECRLSRYCLVGLTYCEGSAASLQTVKSAWFVRHTVSVLLNCRLSIYCLVSLSYCEGSAVLLTLEVLPGKFDIL